MTTATLSPSLLLQEERHSIKRERCGGTGLDSSVVPVCSCGWKGRPEYAHNDWQMTNVMEQEREHLRKAFTTQPVVAEEA